MGVDFWRWVPHPEVWVLVGGLVGLYVYAARVIGPKAVPAGTPAITSRQKACFVAGILLLWVSTDWPVHDIGEKYLYLVHMSSTWCSRWWRSRYCCSPPPSGSPGFVLGRGRVDRWIHQLARPVPALVLFNGLALLTHWQVIVNTSSENGLFHYGMHTAIVTTALLLWIPVCGPLPELRISLPAQMLYLFVTSIVPTVPGAWLTFAEGAVYGCTTSRSDSAASPSPRTSRSAGLIMKLVGGTYLWVLIALIFFRWANRHDEADLRGGPHRARGAHVGGVRAEFDQHPAAEGTNRLGVFGEELEPTRAVGPAARPVTHHLVVADQRPARESPSPTAPHGDGRSDRKRARTRRAGSRRGSARRPTWPCPEGHRRSARRGPARRCGASRPPSFPRGGRASPPRTRTAVGTASRTG